MNRGKHPTERCAARLDDHAAVTNKPVRDHRGQLVRADAESITGIKHQQVSRWAKGLNDPDAYRKRLVTPDCQHPFEGNK
jgi:hypothetical protein